MVKIKNTAYPRKNEPENTYENILRRKIQSSDIIDYWKRYGRFNELLYEKIKEVRGIK